MKFCKGTVVQLKADRSLYRIVGTGFMRTSGEAIVVYEDYDSSSDRVYADSMCKFSDHFEPSDETRFTFHNAVTLLHIIVAVGAIGSVGYMIYDNIRTTKKHW